MRICKRDSKWVCMRVFSTRRVKREQELHRSWWELTAWYCHARNKSSCKGQPFLNWLYTDYHISLAWLRIIRNVKRSLLTSFFVGLNWMNLKNSEPTLFFTRFSFIHSFIHSLKKRGWIIGFMKGRFKLINMLDPYYYWAFILIYNDVEVSLYSKAQLLSAI
jgi:hypothetical protein